MSWLWALDASRARSARSASPLGLLAPLGYLGEPLPCAIGGLAVSCSSWRKASSTSGASSTLKSSQSRPSPGMMWCSTDAARSLSETTSLIVAYSGKPRELLEAELRVGRRAVGRDGLGAPAGDGPADPCEAL